MFKEKNRSYISWGLTALAVVTAALLLSYILNSFAEVKALLISVLNILMPFIVGLVMTFLMAPLYNRLVAGLSRMFRGSKPERKGDVAEKIARFLATAICVFLILVVLTALTAMLIPQLISGVTDMINSMPQNSTSFQSFVHALFHEKYPDYEQLILRAYEQVSARIYEWANREFMPNINKYVLSLTSGVLKILASLKNFFLGLIIMAYGLNMKETLGTQLKRMLYGLFPVNGANCLIEECRFVKKTFSDFIVGKIIDSLIIGIICYICMNFMKFPYPLLISVFVGVTNIIPFFGPFIGAIPSALIILMTDPFAVIPFLIFILVLQQFDGNILGPKILGSATGVSSFWVLFSILFFGGLWGIVGMIIGIPTFAVIARLLERFISNRLEKRGCRTELEAYDCLSHVEVGPDGKPVYYYSGGGTGAGSGTGTAGLAAAETRAIPGTEGLPDPETKRIGESGTAASVKDDSRK